MHESPTFIEEATVLKSPLSDVSARLNALGNTSLDSMSGIICCHKVTGGRQLLFTLDREEIERANFQTQKFFRDLGQKNGSSIYLSLNNYPQHDPRSIFLAVMPPVNEDFFDQEYSRNLKAGSKKSAEELRDNDLWWIRQEVRPVNATFGFTGRPDKDGKVSNQSKMVLKAEANLDFMSRRGAFSYPVRMFEDDQRLKSLLSGLAELFEGVTVRRVSLTRQIVGKDAKI